MSERSADQGVTCSVEGYEWLRGARAEWDDLVEASTCDPLFNGWAWRSCWWRAYSEADERFPARLCILVLRNAQGRLDAVLPLYLHRVALRGALRWQRLELLGCNLRGGRDDLELSEYCDGCVRRDCEQVAADAFSATLLALDWDDFSAQGVREDSWLQQALLPALQQRSQQTHRALRVRQLDAMRSWGVRLIDAGDNWRSRLSSNVRRRVIGQRGRIAEASFEAVERADFPALLQELNGYHVARWGRPVYSPQRQLFHERLLALLPENALAASTLRAGDSPISVLYNLRLNRHEYNLQSGFNAAASHGLSPGYQHLGYAIERAAQDGMVYFDMLGGDGRARAYKADLGQHGCTMFGWQVLRSPGLKLLYRAWDAWGSLRRRSGHS